MFLPFLGKRKKRSDGAQWYTCRALVGFSVAMVTHSDQNQVRGEVGPLVGFSVAVVTHTDQKQVRGKADALVGFFVAMVNTLAKTKLEEKRLHFVLHFQVTVCH